MDDALDDDHVSIDDEENIDGSSEDDEEAEYPNRSQWIQLGEERKYMGVSKHRMNQMQYLERMYVFRADMQAWLQHNKLYHVYHN